MTRQSSGEQDRETPSILTKAFDLLRAFNSRERVMTLSELARASGLPKSTVHRLIPRLIDLGAIEPHRAGYRIGLGLLELGSTTPAGSMRDRAMPNLVALHRATGLTVHLGVLRQFDVVFLENLSRLGTPSLARVGSRLPANCTAAGKALLAWEAPEYLESSLPSPMPTMTPASTTSVAELLPELRRIRAERLAHERNQAQWGMECLAAPVIVYDAAVAAVSVSYDTETKPGTKTQWMLHETACRIANEVRVNLAAHPHWFPRER